MLSLRARVGDGEDDEFEASFRDDVHRKLVDVRGDSEHYGPYNGGCVSGTGSLLPCHLSLWYPAGGMWPNSIQFHVCNSFLLTSDRNCFESGF